MSRLWVFDTNVLVSALLKREGACGQLLRHVSAGRIRMAWTPDIRAEYREVLNRGKFPFQQAVINEMLALVAPAHQVRPGVAPSLPDPDDEPFIAAALATADRVLVTGNIKDYPPASRAGVEVLSVREALHRLGE
jgi:putative PIN family toxin of toxin-antitoxin system